MKAKKEENHELLIGGQAVIEGVLMRAKEEAAVAVRTEKGRIVTKKWKIKPVSRRVRLFKYPLIRGTGVLYETLALGFKALTFSANAAAGQDEKGKNVLGRKEMAISFAAAILLAVGLFIVAPLFLAGLVAAKENNFLFNLIDGLFRLLALLAYLVFISLFKDVQRLFQYHGAEHMTIHAHEHGEKLVPAKIRKYPTMHPRCGTSFLLLVVLVSVFAFTLVNPESFAMKALSRVALLPVIAGVAYEALRLGAKFGKNPLMKAIVLPGLLLQRITTKEPDSSQIEVAVAALNALKRKN